MTASPRQITRAEIEAKPHTKAQLRAWGIEWPPKKGWKRRLWIGIGEPMGPEEEAYYREMQKGKRP